ncbi:MAG TPA: ATP-binding cassette domain-containing protein, partial [Motiliproteus sp.]
MNPQQTFSSPADSIAHPLLQVTQLRKQFGGQPVLSIDEFTIAAGEVALLVGRNGAGKSTLLRILAGLEPADSGTLWLHGKALPRAAQRHLRGEVIYLHQHPYLFDTRVRDNIEYGLRCAGLPKTERQARIDQALEWSGLEHLGDRH